MQLTNEQWDRYLKQYKGLLFKIANMISGDNMVASPEDNYSDLCIAALNSIEGYHKKTGQSFDEMMGTKEFDQYTKSCLWHLKASKGAKLTEKIAFRKNHISLNDEIRTHDYNTTQVYTIIEDTSSLGRNFDSVDYTDLIKSDPRLVKLVDEVNKDPNLLTSDGKLILNQTAKKLKISTHKLEYLLSIMTKKLYGNN